MILRWMALFRRRPAPAAVSATAGVAAGRDIVNSPITINDNAEVLQALAGLTRQLIALHPAMATPVAEAQVGEAVGSIARGAAGGDERLRTALDLLREDKVADAVRTLQAVADEKTSRIRQDSKDAAAAYRNLGAIAGLRDPKQALDAYLKAIEFDPDDRDGLLWVGWLELGRGSLDSAERRFRAVVASARGEGEAWLRFWSRLGLGDIRAQRGDLSAARADYREGAAIAERLTGADPGNAGWQRDLSVSHERLGDAQAAQGDLGAALAGYRASLGIAERLARSDPGNAEWQRDLSVSHNKLGDVQRAQGDLGAALAGYRASLAIRERLARSDPGNAEWQRDLAVSHAKIGGISQMNGEKADALRAFTQGRKIMADLTRLAPDHAQWRQDLAWFERQVADLSPIKAKSGSP